MDHEQLLRFAQKHGKVSFVDTNGTARTLPSGEPDELPIHADRFLWDGEWRSRKEMAELIAQSEQGQHPGCVECERLRKELVLAREQDRKEGNLEGRYEKHALHAFKEHRGSHQ